MSVETLYQLHVTTFAVSITCRHCHQNHHHPGNSQKGNVKNNHEDDNNHNRQDDDAVARPGRHKRRQWKKMTTVSDNNDHTATKHRQPPAQPPPSPPPSISTISPASSLLWSVSTTKFRISFQLFVCANLLNRSTLSYLTDFSICFVRWLSGKVLHIV